MSRLAAAAIVTVVLAGCSGSAATALPTGTLQITTTSATVTLTVQIARTPEARQHGLMGRTSLAPDAGMVFVDQGPTDATFWMKDTLVPLSIAFWDADGHIVDVQDMAPCRADLCPLYRSTALFVGAVEVNLGFFSAHGIRVGDAVRLTETPPSSR